MRVKVWDPFVRVFHWTIVTVFFADYFFLEGGYRPHDWLGYGVLGLIVLRIGWGFVGARHARFRDFVPTPAVLLAYTRDMLHGRERRYLGHNPAGAMMMITLIVLTAGLCMTGWMHHWDMFWGDEWVVELHVLLSNLIVALVIVHVAAAILVSLKQKENLVAAMITGYKESDGSDGTTPPAARPAAKPTTAFGRWKDYWVHH